MAENIGGGRVVTFCPLCKQADDHPKHPILGEDPSIARHLDCCQAAGCPDRTCDLTLASKQPGAGQPMLDHIRKANEGDKLMTKHRALVEQEPALAQWTRDDLPKIELQGVVQP